MQKKYAWALSITMIIGLIALLVNTYYFHQDVKESLWFRSLFIPEARAIINNIEDMQLVRKHFWSANWICLLTNVALAIIFFFSKSNSKIIGFTIIASCVTYFLISHLQSEILRITVDAAIALYLFVTAEFAIIYGYCRFKCLD